MNLAIAALLKAHRECIFVHISLLLDSGGSIVICDDIMRSLGVRFNPIGPDQHVPMVKRSIGTIKSKAIGILNTLPYNLLVRWLMYLVQFVVTSRINCMPMRQSHG